MIISNFGLVNGKLIRKIKNYSMVMGYIFHRHRFTKDTLLMTKKMAKALINGQMVISMMDSLYQIKNVDMLNITITTITL